ncbi:MAG: cysteine desulfurase [Acidimicrobiales bacterium]|nr:MAG: cysteine desulfurase [Acidimicrobiales bacterium]
MNRWFDAVRGDPSRIHSEGMEARALIEEGREEIAAFLGARSREVVFTSGATESIVTALLGATRGSGHVVTCAVEHSAVLRTCERLPEVTVVGVDPDGRVDPERIADAIRPDTALVSIQWGNHEVATRQPVEEVAAVCRERGVLFHVDAAQAVGHDVVHFGRCGADLLSVSAHKFGGPPGIGALLVRRGLRISPLLVGGDQERARRAGLENGPAILGFAAACGELAGGKLQEEIERQRKLTEHVAEQVLRVEGVRRAGHPGARLSHIVCFLVEDVEPQAILLELDRAGIAVHSGSACSSESIEPSPVLEAMGVDAQRSLRVSVGWCTTEEDVTAFVASFEEAVRRLRKLRTQMYP